MKKKYTRKQLIAASNAVGYSFDNDVGLFDSVQKYKADPELAINFWTDAVGSIMIEKANAKDARDAKKGRPVKNKEKVKNNGRKWHIGHVKPLSSFDLTNREQFQLACHYTNMVPVWIDEEENSGTGATDAPLN